MKILNQSSGMLTLATGQSIAPRAFLELSEEEFAPNLNSLVVRAWIDSGRLDVSGLHSDETQTTSSPDPSRESIVRAAMAKVVEAGGDGLTADGKPKTDAINAILNADGQELTTSTERDALWTK